MRKSKAKPKLKLPFKQSTTSRLAAVVTKAPVKSPVAYKIAKEAVGKKSTNRTREALQQVTDMQGRMHFSDAEAAKAIGYKGGNNLSGWCRDGTAPVVAGLAAECLVRRQGNGATAYKGPETILVIRAPNDSVASIKQVAKALGAKISEV